jgi:peptidoglycan-N-acetylmuramic acid deacetylase
MKRRAKKKKPSKGYILLLFALMIITLTAAAAVHILKNINGEVTDNSQNPAATPTHATPSSDNNETHTPPADIHEPVITVTSVPTSTPVPRPVSAPTPAITEPTFPTDTPIPVSTPTPAPITTETAIPANTPTPVPVQTSLPIIQRIDETKLAELDKTVRGWSWAYPYKEVEKHGGIYKKNGHKKVIYLTMDAGYENGHMPKILDVLKEKNVRTIFFVTGSYIRKNPDLVRRMVEEDHLVGNHTNSHPDMAKEPVERFIEELVIVEKEYEKLFGSDSRMFYYRPPGGVFSIRDIYIASQMGYETVFWSFAYKDWDDSLQLGEDYAHDTVVGGLHDGMILLLHTTSKDNAEALGRIIDSARASGYEFRRIDE